MGPEDARDPLDDRVEPQHAGGAGPTYIHVYDEGPEGYDGTCLRPLGLCKLGGCCDACWYNPDHPRFHNDNGQASADPTSS